MKPLVSICCITYNHEKYIADAIESFIMQKVDFPIEIVIHDDASTDNTANIIRQYENRYPDVIKPIYQTENQYSKGIDISAQLVYPKTRGKYIAICEGDDYWTDPYKLKKQVDFMERNQEYSMVFHGVEVVNTEGNFIGRYLGPYKSGNRECTLSENCKGGFVHASSIFMRAKFVNRNVPDWFYNARHSDYALILLLSVSGKTYFIDEIMSAYRTGVENSAMTLLKKNYTVENEIKYLQQRIDTYDKANKYYKYKFSKDIEKVNLLYKVKILILKKKYFELIHELKNKKYFKEISFLSLLKAFMLTRYPKCSKVLIKIKYKYVLFKKERSNSN